MATVKLEKLTKIYPNGVRAVTELDLTVAEGEFMVLVGPSGCGKTTALRMVAGLEEISEGALRIGDRVVNELSPTDRDIAMVFQNYALYPHMTVAENIGFALRLRKLPKAEIRARVESAARILGLVDHLNRKPAQLSGGQRQRVAMGRAIVREPAVFLMDEPLSNLDAKLRVQMRAEISEVQRRLGVATFYVTHDQTEAMTMGDRVAVLRLGVLQQCDTPTALYERPKNLFVAAFIGSPAMNIYEGLLADDVNSLRIGSQTLSIPAGVRTRRPRLAAFAGRQLLIGIRPEHLADAEFAHGDIAGSTLVGDVRLTEALGSELMVHFDLDTPRVMSDDAAAASEDEESIADLAKAESSVGAVRSAAVARVHARSSMRPGQRGTFAVDNEHLHFFDPATAEAIWD